MNKSLIGKSRARLASPFWRLKFRWRRKQWSGAVSSFPTCVSIFFFFDCESPLPPTDSFAENAHQERYESSSSINSKTTFLYSTRLLDLGQSFFFCFYVSVPKKKNHYLKYIYRLLYMHSGNPILPSKSSSSSSSKETTLHFQ